MSSSMIIDDVLDTVGNTPLVRLNKLAKEEGLKCNLLAKVEFFSLGGSVKDRVAKRMVLEAEKEGILVPGKSVVIEPTSGNTGIGLALACAIKGYPLIITLPDKMSLEKETLLRALGAEVVRTPSVPWYSEDSNIGVARRLQKSIPHAVILDQYHNPNNPLAHELTTGPEIIAAITSSSSSRHLSSGRVDALIGGAGTGGTLTGVARAIKKTHNTDAKIIGIDPRGSILALPETLNEEGKDSPYAVEGIGYDFVPEVLARDEVDVWIKTNDEEAFGATHRLIRLEGLLVGGSSGSAIAGALKWLKGEGWNSIGGVEGTNAVVLLPDGIRNYMSKPWFRDAALNQPPSQLSETISKILSGNSSESATANHVNST